MFDDQEIIFDLMAEGIDAYLLKECSIEEMEEAIETVHKNMPYSNAQMNNAVLNDISSKSKLSLRKNQFNLTDRELVVIKMICDGRSSDFISKQLPTSKKNVDFIRTKIMKKLNIKSANQLMRIAILNGFYSPRTDLEIEQEIIDEQYAASIRRMNKLIENNSKNS
jgi:DNA-binding NarL/FixJ family response regulator